MNIRVRVTTGAKKDSIKVISEKVIQISVKEKPQENRANRRTLALIAAHFGVSARQVRILTGHRSTTKMLEIRA